MARLTKSRSSQPGGCISDGSSYPESERAYFEHVYGSDHLKQLFDGHQKKAMSRHVKPWKRAELDRVQNRLAHLKCANDPEMTQPGRSAYSLKQLHQNLVLYCGKQQRSLRWNEHYQQALQSVADDVKALIPNGCLHPISTEAVAESESLQRNLDKHAGYCAFETGRRSKGENLEFAVEWCSQNLERILDEGHYGLPYVISHRSSNSKPISPTEWKWRCRIILMEDIRASLLTGHFAIPFIKLFLDAPWGEGGMTQEQVRGWVHRARRHKDCWYSSDYSKFDTSQPSWLIEDAFYHVIRPLFGELSPEDERWFETMVSSYINKDIHAFDGIYHVKGCQISGSLLTYSLNTVINQIIDRTALLMQGCEFEDFDTLKCGDDNLTYYSKGQPWSADKHAELIKRFFGIETRLEDGDYGSSVVSPKFLSKVWTDNGEERDISEVIFNLLYPERFRNYDPKVTGVPEERAEALVLLAACLEQEATMRQWFDIDSVYAEAGVKRNDVKTVYQALANLGSGFRTQWIRWKFELAA